MDRKVIHHSVFIWVIGLILIIGTVFGYKFYTHANTDTTKQSSISLINTSSSSSVISIDPIPTILPIKLLPITKTEPVQLSVIMYHHILGWSGAEGDKIEQGLRVSPEIFEKHLQYLQKNNFTTITTKDLYEYGAGITKSLPTNPVLLTFDDGYLDNYTLGLPLLKKYYMVGDFAIITSVIGTPEYMSWAQVNDLVNKGNYLSSHTVHHCQLASKDKSGYPKIWLPTPIDDTDKQCSGFTSYERLKSGQVRAELRDSKKIIEDNTGIKVYSIVYPYGGFNDTVVSLAMEEKYLLGFTVVGEIGGTITLADPLRIPRYRAFGQDTGNNLQGFFAGGR
jgi:peptidoglycan/xylan/chitin deacetylase (PgdA/CDA1 family)